MGTNSDGGEASGSASVLDYDNLVFPFVVLACGVAGGAAALALEGARSRANGAVAGCRLSSGGRKKRGRRRLSRRLTGGGGGKMATGKSGFTYSTVVQSSAIEKINPINF